MFTEIAPDVYAVAHRLVDGKNAIVFGEQSALAIDACNYADEGEAMAAFIRARGHDPRRLALTHGHGDHILGSGAFRGAHVYAHTAVHQTIDQHLPNWAERYFQGSLEVAEAAITRPNILFDDELVVDLGGKTVRLFSTPGHTPDAACAWIDEDRVLCGGDTIVTGIVPAINDGDSRTLEATLERLAEMPAEVLVPGHGMVVYGRAAIAEHLAWMVAYLRGVRAAAHEPADASYARLVGDRFSDEPFGMRRRHAMVVARIRAEVNVSV